MEAGQVYNSLTAIRLHHRTPKKAFWVFRCICEKEHIAGKREVEIGATKSCGCMKGYYLRNRTPRVKALGEASKNALLYSYRINAKKRGLEFSLTKEEFEKITKQNCYFCGDIPRQGVNYSRFRNGDYIYNGLDRLDNEKGYTIENTVPSCYICNRAKNTLTIKQFKDWIQRISINLWTI
ncbi:MAG: hypothetical protein ACRDFB_10040 [Rhabdochlamydiaceae bacterium]